MPKRRTYNQDELRQALTELAMDLHWSWNHAADKIWQLLDPVLWEITHNPLVVTQTVSQERIAEVLGDPVAKRMIQEFDEFKRKQQGTPLWFQKQYPKTPLSCVAYFSMEFMLSEALPIYSGGLGNVAGDHLKTASDLGVPVIGIGLLYQQGYTRQVVYQDGTQQYVAPFNDPGQLPLKPLRQENGEWLRIEVKLPGYSVWLRTWQVQVGRTTLFLLDSNDAANFPVYRGITNKLYGSEPELRFLQELILGIGGWRLLKLLGIKPEVCHLNEGHSAFVVVERALHFMEENNVPFDVALAITRSGNVFTTHTAIGAGFDRFSPALIDRYLGRYINGRLKLSLVEFLALGRQRPDDHAEHFNIGYLAIKGSGYVNGVSRLHSTVSKRLFAGLFPRWPLEEVPVGYVTNGVHMSTWDSPEADQVWTEVCGKERWLGAVEPATNKVLNISDVSLWEMRLATKKTCIEKIHSRYARQLATTGAPLPEVEAVDSLLNPAVLTLGFARRFVSYKRPNLLLQDPIRLHKLLTNKEAPVQLLLAGKAHPDDKEGQALVKNWLQFVIDFKLEDRVLFLSDYDMSLTEQLVQGVDVWINTPRRPWEACGTSGMKVLVNGGLNLSTFDGWWDEAYAPEVGWAIGERSGLESNVMSDEEEAQELYRILEQQVIPAFYTRNEDGIPTEWVGRIRKSMAMLTPRFSSNRSLRQYLDDYYIPAAVAYKKRAANKGELGRQMVEGQKNLREKWSAIRFGELVVNATADSYQFRVSVFLNGLVANDVQVELFASGNREVAPVRKQMQADKSQLSHDGYSFYTVEVPNDRPAEHFTPRIIPYHEDLSIPLECNAILWYH